MRENPALTVTVVIPSYNSGQFLGPCLDALQRSALTPLECIVVDDGSTDDSAALASARGASVISSGGPYGPAHARNLGAKQAQGDLILFLDSDVCVHPDTIAKIVAAFHADPTLDAVMGAYDETPAVPTFVSQYRNLLHCFTHRQGRAHASTFWCGCGTVRREIFLSHGGLDESYERPAIEDVEFGTRLAAEGRNIRLDWSIQVQHLKRWTLWTMLRTDILDRGIPWSLLILRLHWFPDDLNVRWSQRLSVALAGLLLASAFTPHFLITGACFLALLAANAPFYSFLGSRRGLWFTARAIPVHVLFHFSCGVSFASALALHWFSSPAPIPVPAPQPIEIRRPPSNPI